MSDVKYPHITVRLVGEDCNAFAVMGAVQRELRRGGVPADEVKAVIDDMTSGDYNHLLAVAMDTVNVV